MKVFLVAIVVIILAFLAGYYLGFAALFLTIPVGFALGYWAAGER